MGQVEGLQPGAAVVAAAAAAAAAAAGWRIDGSVEES